MQFLKLVLFLITLYPSNFCYDQCVRDEDCEFKSQVLKHLEESDPIGTTIDKAMQEYKPCKKEGCHNQRIFLDLDEFSNGITRQMIEAVRNRGTLYQVIDQKMYRQRDCMFPARCSGVEHFLKPLLKKLPNMELVINVRDWPQIYKDWRQTKGPVLSFSKTVEYADIMYPTWGFWEGGPAISLYPTGIGRWDKHRQSISKAAEKHPWKSKISKAFFRGSRTSSERDSLVLLSREQPGLVDAQYTKNQAWKSPKDTLNAPPASEVSLEEHCQFKYLFNFRGVAASFRLKHLFLCKSLVFHVGDEWKEFFYDSLKPWVHYVPVKSDPSIDELRSLIQYFSEHDYLAEEIANRGFEQIWNHLRLEDCEQYWENLLTSYGKLLKYNVTLDQTLLKIS
ncbi:O-glucosyltransferase rumi [Sergentomyia squamirostris]